MTHNVVAERIRRLTLYRESLAADYLTAINQGNYDMAAVYEKALREVDEQLSELLEKQNSEGE